MKTQNKLKIINDPVYGFINIPSEIIFDLIEHPYFQRLRRIKQLGHTPFVYPGTRHTRCQHALGAMYLVIKAIETLKSKGHEINDEEAESVTIAILLHDIGHGPFSHALEQSIVNGVSHEELSLLFMNKLNIIFEGKLSMAIDIFLDKYPKKYLHQLVSGQMDMDRLDYLRRDSFFSGVSEGVIGSERIIKMLNVFDGKLVIESKGIYSIEKFLIARRLMYWQVYLHKTVLTAEQMLLTILKRAVDLTRKGHKLYTTPALEYFLNNAITKHDFTNNKTDVNGKSVLDLFASLDDDDLSISIKNWATNSDKVLSRLAYSLLNRQLFKIEIQDSPFSDDKILGLEDMIERKYQVNKPDIKYFLISNSISNYAYTLEDSQIDILYNNGEIKELSIASDILNIEVLSRNVKKYFIIYPKDLAIK